MKSSLREKIKNLLRKVINFFNLGDIDFDTMYISSGEALPSPLNADEENEAIEKFMGGDENARSLLIERNLRLVVYIAKRFDNTGVDMEDLISIGTIGLIKAVNSFNSNKNIKLATYASRCIENEILMHLRKTSRLKGEISLDEPLNVDWEGNTLLLSDVLGTDSDAIYNDVEAGSEKEMLKKTFEKLPKREREIVEMRFGLGGKEEKTQKEIAEMMGISQSYISRLEKKIVAKLKREISKLE